MLRGRTLLLFGTAVGRTFSNTTAHTRTDLLNSGLGSNNEGMACSVVVDGEEVILVNQLLLLSFFPVYIMRLSLLGWSCGALTSESERLAEVEFLLQALKEYHVIIRLSLVVRSFASRGRDRGGEGGDPTRESLPGAGTGGSPPQ